MDAREDLSDEMPLSAFRKIGLAVERTIKLHEERMHATNAHSCSRPIQAIPFPDLCIPDESLAKMVELLDTDPELGLEALAARFDYPVSLVERELPLYLARYQSWIESEASRLTG